MFGVTWHCKDLLEELCCDFFEYVSARPSDPSNSLLGTAVPPRALPHLLPLSPSDVTLTHMHSHTDPLVAPSEVEPVDDFASSKGKFRGISDADVTSLILRWDALCFCPEQIAKEVHMIAAELKGRRKGIDGEIVAVRW